MPAPKQQMIGRQDWTYVSKPSQLARDAHEAQSEITSLCFSLDGRCLLSRSTDGSMKLWDLRRLAQPLSAYAGALLMMLMPMLMPCGAAVLRLAPRWAAAGLLRRADAGACAALATHAPVALWGCSLSQPSRC